MNPAQRIHPAPVRPLRAGRRRPFVAALLLLLAASGLAGAGIAPARAAAPVSIGATAPDFTLAALDGRNRRLAEQRGQVVMLNFWASWCAPCKQEMPQLSRLYEKYRDAGFVMLGVNVDRQRSNAAEVATRLALGFPVLLDGDQRISSLYQLKDMPTTVLIDRDGRVRYVQAGYHEGYESRYEAEIRSLLKE